MLCLTDIADNGEEELQRLQQKEGLGAGGFPGVSDAPTLQSASDMGTGEATQQKIDVMSGLLPGVDELQNVGEVAELLSETGVSQGD